MRLEGESWESLAERLRGTLIAYHSLEESAWKPVTLSSDVSIWRRPSEDFSGYLYKTVGGVPAAPSTVVEFLRPGERRLKWDSLVTHMEVTEAVGPDICITRYTTAGQLWNVIAPREFVDLSLTTDIQHDGLLSCGVSVDLPSSPSRRSVVRGFNHPCGWFCRGPPFSSTPAPPQGPGTAGMGCQLTGYVHTDLRGLLPRSAVDGAMASALARFYRDLRTALRHKA